MSLTEASERSGVPEERIRMYEEGERQPYAKTLRRLAQIYGVSARELSAAGGSASAGISPRPAASRERRRRRRVRSEEGGADAHASVEVPIEVEQGQTIRVVIELIIRPKAPVQSGAAAPAETRSDPSPGADAAEGPQPGPGFRHRGSRGPGPRSTEQGFGPRPQRVAAGPNGGPDLGEPKDPLDEFRRAYSQFRREKR